MSVPTPDSISPSRMSTFLDCPYRFYGETIVKLPRKTGAAALRGTAGHRALELLMQEDGPDRTPELLAEFVERALKEIKSTDDYQKLEPKELKDFDAFVRRTAPRIFEMEDVPQLEVEATEEWWDVDLDGWNLRGIVDLLLEGPVIADYKFGRTPSERFQKKLMLGIEFYSLMFYLRSGDLPVEAKLLYLESRTSISFEPTQRGMNGMRAKVLAVRDAIHRSCETEVFKPNPSKLCDWCDVKPYCPAWGGSLDDFEAPARLKS